MGLDFSQKRLLSMARHARSKRLKLYAFYTGLMSTMISLAQLLVTALK